MYFANPWGLLGLLSLPLIAFIHLYQRRFPRLEVGGLHLWISDDQVKTAGMRRDRLPITRTLLLELLAAILLTTLLARPQLENLSTTTHWIFVVDSSASMMATTGSGESFRDRAMAEMQSRVDETGRRSLVSVILTGTRPTMLAGPAVSWEDAEATLRSWIPQGTRHNFQSAWDMASQLAETTGRLVFVTDDRQTETGFPARMELVSVGESLSNLAFETTRWSIDGESLQASLYMRVRNHSDIPAEADIVGSVDSQEVFRKKAQLAAGSSLPLSVALPGGIKTLDLAIESQADHLLTDSKIQLIEPGLRTVKVALLLDDDHPSRQSIERLLDAAANIQRVSDIGQASLLVTNPDTDGFGDQSETVDNVASELWQLAIGPVDPDPAVREAATATSGPFLLDRRDPLLEGVSLQGTIWSGYQGVDWPMSPLISVGKKILFGRRTDTLATSFLLDIDFESSNINDSPDFPILISNLIEGCRANLPGLRRWNYHLNEMVEFDLDPASVDLGSTETLTLHHESGPRDIARSVTVEIPPLSRTGIYEVTDKQKIIGRFAVNFFDAEESDLSRLTNGVVAANEESDSLFQSSESAPWIWMLLIVAVMAIALLNWAGLRSRVDKSVSNSGTEAASP